MPQIDVGNWLADETNPFAASPGPDLIAVGIDVDRSGRLWVAGGGCETAPLPGVSSAGCLVVIQTLLFLSAAGRTARFVALTAVVPVGGSISASGCRR
jgi:hypothetical protein